MIKPVKKVVKGSTTRERKKLIVVGTEGKNKTEELYLRQLEKKQTTYRFIFSPANYTDPVQIVNATIKRARKESLRYKSGDIAASIFDLDLSDSKKQQLLKAKEIGEKNHIDIITSNPCIEIWFLEHFGYTSKMFNSSREVIKELKKYLPNYSKTDIQSDIIAPLTIKALNNCERLDKYHCENSLYEQFEFCNPRTDMYKFVKRLIE